MTTAIHQPNFFPWLGIFHRISLVDTFVFFDHVQAMGGKSWLSRNKILLNGEAIWLTIPIYKRDRLHQKITEVEINYETNFVRKHYGTLKQSYGKSPHYEEIMNFVKQIYEQEFQYLSDFNKAFIKNTCEKLELYPTFVTSTDIVNNFSDITDTSGNELVLEICKNTKTNNYISGTGCLDFINPESFAKQGINFDFQSFKHPTYKQGFQKEFVSHLSILDALFHVGFEGTKNMLIGDKNE